ncbi:hypothetical protein CTAYLR_007068 [Chrysophaeum taylorii]|uniref:TRAF3-interacting protein 1 N-terminal domain-containing protein n=1 Tax=Chrysophaeum taylorii TaxID=2483200 RepID=A0AAD7ULI9_9STRA|nr:hypothetical protein CTAYLR_007068 [Chrysophaeum taylorii]
MSLGKEAREMADAVRRVVADETLREAIQKTQDSFAGIITKPALTTRMLSRPPVAFLFAVFENVRAATGFATGLFEEEEEPPKARSDKIRFLVRLIGCIAFALEDRDIEIRCVPARLVAGQDALAANALLQALARAAGVGDPRATAAVARTLELGEVSLYERAISIRRSIARCQAIIRGRVKRRRLLAAPKPVAETRRNAAEVDAASASADAESASADAESASADAASASADAASASADAASASADAASASADAASASADAASASADAASASADAASASADAASASADAASASADAASASADAASASAVACKAAAANAALASADAANAALAAGAAIELRDQQRQAKKLQAECRARIVRLRAAEDHFRVQQSMLDSQYETVARREEKAKQLADRARRQLKKLKKPVENQNNQTLLDQQQQQQQQDRVEEKIREIDPRRKKKKENNVDEQPLGGGGGGRKKPAVRKVPQEPSLASSAASSLGSEYAAAAKKRLKAKEEARRLRLRARETEEPAPLHEDIKRSYEALGGKAGVFGRFLKDRLLEANEPTSDNYVDSDDIVNDGATASCAAHDPIKSKPLAPGGAEELPEKDDTLPPVSTSGGSSSMGIVRETNEEEPNQEPKPPDQAKKTDRRHPRPRKVVDEGAWISKFDKDFQRALKTLEQAR